MRSSALLVFPVVEYYGMTEAASYITSNPRERALQKLGSVGVSVGPEVRILGPDGSEAAPGVEGEIAIRGSNVIRHIGETLHKQTSVMVGS